VRAARKVAPKEGKSVQLELWIHGESVHHLVKRAFAALAWSAHIYREQRFSDHAPMTLTHDFTL
jgi:exodeoxyribonuclease-3